MRSLMYVFQTITHTEARGKVLFILAFLLSTSVASAQCDWMVRPDGTGDFPTIQAAINSGLVQEGDVICLTDGKFTGAGNRDIDYGGRAITIRSESGNPESCIIDCEGTIIDPHRGFVFLSGETGTSVLRDVTVTHGLANSGGAVLCDLSSPSFVNCIFEANSATFTGGAVYCTHSSPTFIDCKIWENASGLDGGGVYCMNESLPGFTNCIIRHNTAIDFGIENSGGGIFLFGSSPTFTDCHIDSNSTDDFGGGVACNFSSGSFDGCTIADNSAGNGGGVLSEGEDETEFSDCFIRRNSATDGGGVYCRFDGRPSFTLCQIDSNSAMGDGDGIAAVIAALRFADCHIDSNSAGDEGGGIYTNYATPPSLISGTFINSNTAGMNGGGVFFDYSSPDFASSHIEGNSAVNGGGVYCINDSPDFSPSFNSAQSTAMQ